MKTLLEKIEEIEDDFSAVAYAEAADLQDFLTLIKREKGEIPRPEECQYGDNDVCLTES